MTRRNFGQSSGVIIDVCRRHGVWFDRGELPRVIQFVEAGGLGLTRARQREALLAKERQARVEAVERELAGMHVTSSANPFTRAARYRELREASASLLSYLARWVEK